MKLRTFILLPLLAVLAGTTLGCGGPTFDVDTPFVVAFTTPSHGAADIALDAELSVGFNRPVDRDAARAHITLGDSADVLEATLLFTDDDKLVVLVPVRTLPPGESLTLQVDGKVESSEQVKLGTSLAVEFTTSP